MSDNCFLLLGKTGVGKSTLTKILSENPTVKIGSSLNSETQDSICYNCKINDFNYCLIDTPGYDDSNGNDIKNYSHIKQFLTSDKYRIKGIVLIFSFQDARFGESHRKGLEKIVNLVPLENLWDYVTIIFTKTFWDDEDELKEMKDKKLADFQQIFDTLISAFNRAKNIKKVKFSKINKVFVNLKVNKTKKEKLKDITSIFKNNSKLSPLFHKLQIEEKWDKLLIVNKENRNVGDLYDVKYKVYSYYNNKNDVIKVISKPIDKKFIKTLEKTEYDGHFQKNCDKVKFASATIITPSWLGGVALLAFCPPAAAALFGIELIAGSVMLVSKVASDIKTLTEYISNKEFNEQKVIEELLLEED